MVYGESMFLDVDSKVIVVAPGERIKIDGSVDGVTVIIKGEENITWSEAAGTVITLEGNGTVYVPTVYLQNGDIKECIPKEKLAESKLYPFMLDVAKAFFPYLKSLF